MSQKSLEIVGEEWIAPSLVESEYSGLILKEDSIAAVDYTASEYLIFQEDPIFQEYSIDSKDLIFPEYSIDSEDLIFPEDSIANQEIDIDPLTGMARGGGPWWPFPNNSSRVTALKNARLQIDLFGSQARVTATVKVELDTVLLLVASSPLGSSFVLQSSVLGIDGNLLNGRNDRLFNFSNQTVNREGTYTFSKIVPRSLLNEDHSWFNRDDEIAASINLVSYNSLFPLNKKATTPIIRGYF